MQLIEQLTALKRKIDQEDMERGKIKYGDEYAALEKEIEALTAKREAMLLSVPDSSEEYAAVKRQVLDYMKANNLSHVENVSAVTRERKEVNKSRVLNILGGDIDNYIALSTVTQVGLKDFAKSSPYKKDLMDCIEVVGTDIVDLEVLVTADLPDHP